MGQHGVYDFERSGSQVFSADLTLHVDSRKAAQTDDVRYTVDYAKIADAAVEILTGKPVYLLETLAHNLAEMALATPQVLSVEVTIHKPMAPVRHQFTDVSVTISRNRRALEGRGEPAANTPSSSRVVLSLGSNLGDSESILNRSVEALMEIRGLEIDDVSPLVVTAPVLADGQAPQPNYRNAVVLARTILQPVELLKALQSVEQQFGRTRDERWGARTLDIDIIDIGGVTEKWPELELPHPRAQARAFVLYPWSLVAPEATMPDGRRVVDLAQTAPDRPGILETRTDWLREPGDKVSVAPPAPLASPVAGPPAVLQVPPPPHSPAHFQRHPAATPPVAKPVAAPPVPKATPRTPSRYRKTVTIRGNEVNLEAIGGDMAFQKLLRKEWLREVSREAPRSAPRPAPAAPTVAPRAEQGSAAAPPPRRRLPEASVPPSPIPVPAPAPEPVFETVFEEPIPEAPQPAGETELRLPDWRPVRNGNAVRIVDAVEVSEVEQEEPALPASDQEFQRRRVVRPTPTGMMPLSNRRPQEGRQ